MNWKEENLNEKRVEIAELRDLINQKHYRKCEIEQRLEQIVDKLFAMILEHISDKLEIKKVKTE